MATRVDLEYGELGGAKAVTLHDGKGGRTRLLARDGFRFVVTITEEPMAPELAELEVAGRNRPQETTA